MDMTGLSGQAGLPVWQAKEMLKNSLKPADQARRPI